METLGGNALSFSLSGQAIAPDVALSATTVAFGAFETGRKVSRVVYVQNRSSAPISFEFGADPGGVFSTDPVRGTVPPQSAAPISIAFSPAVPNNYWRRVVCLIKVGLAAPSKP